MSLTLTPPPMGAAVHAYDEVQSRTAALTGDAAPGTPTPVLPPSPLLPPPGIHRFPLDLPRRDQPLNETPPPAKTDDRPRLVTTHRAAPPLGNNDHIELTTKLFRLSARSTFTRVPLKRRNGNFDAVSLPIDASDRELKAAVENQLTILDSRLRKMREASGLMVRIEVAHIKDNQGAISLYESPVKTDVKGAPTELGPLRDNLRDRFIERLFTDKLSSSGPAGAA